MQPLAGIKVVDFSALLPGPLASLILAEAGAEVVKVERPAGDELRAYEPRFGAASAGFALLNRGKRSIAIDLKANGARARLMPLLRSADVLIEQFRPGVMERLGLGHARARGGQSAPDLLLDHRLRPERAQGAGRGARSQLSGRDRPAAPRRRRGRRAGGPAGPDRGHRGRQLSGRAQHPARAARARRERARLPSRHRDDRPPVPADVVGARPGFRRKAAGRVRAASCSPAARRGSRSTRPRMPASSPPHRWSSASGSASPS